MRDSIRQFFTLFLLSLSLGGLLFAGPKLQLSDAEKLAKIETLVGEFKDKFKSPYMTVSEAVNHKAAHVFVDIRTPAEQEVSMIEGAITQAAFEKDRAKYKKHKIIAYCTIGYRSAKFSEQIRKDGFDAVSLKGSILSWAHAGKPLVDKKGPTHRVHVAGSSWDLLPKGYEAVYP